MRYEGGRVEDQSCTSGRRNKVYIYSLLVQVWRQQNKLVCPVMCSCCCLKRFILVVRWLFSVITVWINIPNFFFGDFQRDFQLTTTHSLLIIINVLILIDFSSYYYQIFGDVFPDICLYLSGLPVAYTGCWFLYLLPLASLTSLFLWWTFSLSSAVQGTVLCMCVIKMCCFFSYWGQSNVISLFLGSLSFWYNACKFPVVHVSCFDLLCDKSSRNYSHNFDHILTHDSFSLITQKL